MTDDEQQIGSWSSDGRMRCTPGDMQGVLVSHASDIVMFDVPPRHDGVRGIDAYRATWPPFFEQRAQGPVFELVELNITAGEEVAPRPAALRRRALARPKAGLTVAKGDDQAGSATAPVAAESRSVFRF